MSSIRTYRNAVVQMAADGCHDEVTKTVGLTKTEQLAIVRKYINLVSDILDIRYDYAAELIQKALHNQ